MSFKDFFKNKLVNEYMMFPQDAEQVLAEAEAAPALEAMQGRWNDQTDDYPPFMKNITWIGVKDVATKWVKQNIPQAWFLPLLTGEMPE